MALRSPTIIYIWSVAPAPRLTNCCVLFFFSNCSLTLLHINKLMTKSHRELPWITGKSRGKETSFFFKTPQSGGFWQLQMRLASSFHSPPLFIPLIGLLSDLSRFRHPSSSLRGVNDPGGLAGCEQKLVNQDLRREGEDPRHHAGLSDRMWARRARAHTHTCVYARALQRGVVSAGWPDTGVGFRGCLGNEAETIPLTPFWRQTGKVTLGS